MAALKKSKCTLLLLTLALTGTFEALAIASAQPANIKIASIAATDFYTYYDLGYVVAHQSELVSKNITTRGIVKFTASIYMFEDFWLTGQANQTQSITVVTRFAGLPLPQNGTIVEIQGTVRHSTLEGGFNYINASSISEAKNILLIGWDGVQRNHLFELLNSSSLPNLQALTDRGIIANVTITDHRTDTKAGWTQILTGYRWWKTGVFNNVNWFHSIPRGYTIEERVESYFGIDNVATGHITGKMFHMEVINNSGSTATGFFTHEAIYSNIPSQVDVCNVGDRNDSKVGPLALQFIENYSKTQFFGFIHFSDPDSAGHNPAGGENSALYENAIVRCDFWLGQIVNKLASLNLTQNTLLYVIADHGFDEGGFSHNYAPFVSLITNDRRVCRNGDQVDVAPTLYYAMGMWGKIFEPPLDGYPLQVNLPTGEEGRRQSLFDDLTAPAKATISYPPPRATVSGTVPIRFNVSDRYLSAVLLLVNNTLKADGPWTWSSTDGIVQANGLYNWDTANIKPGTYTLSILAFDEHGATNGMSNNTMILNVILQPTPTPSPTTTPTPTLPEPTPTNPLPSSLQPTLTQSSQPTSPAETPATVNTPSPTPHQTLTPTLAQTPAPSAETPATFPPDTPEPTSVVKLESPDYTLMGAAAITAISLGLATIFAFIKRRPK